MGQECGVGGISNLKNFVFNCFLVRPGKNDCIIENSVPHCLRHWRKRTEEFLLYFKCIVDDKRVNALEVLYLVEQTGLFDSPRMRMPPLQEGRVCSCRMIAFDDFLVFAIKHIRILAEKLEGHER